MATAFALAGCSRGPAPDDGGAECQTLTADRIDACVRLNQLQVIGTHNSYHIAPAPAVLAAIGPRGSALEYTHRPLAEQLDRGIRQFELDVFADPDGGRYATPAALTGKSGIPPAAAEMRAPGLKVLHIQDVDVRSTCVTFVACLTAIRDWSRAHPRHVPILVLVEAKDSVPRGAGGTPAAPPLRFGTRELLTIDAEIRSVFDDDQLITPDHVRDGRSTLVDAVRSSGWPLLRDARGKVLFALDNTDDHRLRYLEGAPSLEGRVLFVSSPAGEPSAAFLKMNDALGEGEARIREMVRAGYLVRTRADEPTIEARSGDTTRRDHALRSGAQYVSTDYPEASPFGSGYLARLPDAAGSPARCNPVNAAAGCRHDWLEPSVGPDR
ncbi:MAG: phosphatidylinositol-specific phospholipase C1-like protein [Luteitalea sp.]